MRKRKGTPHRRSKWLAIGVGGVLILSACLSSNAKAELDEYSYDVGWVFGGNELCAGFKEVFETPDQRDDLGRDTTEIIVDRWSGYVTRMITNANLAEPVDPVFFLSGMWDSATAQCTEWFPSPQIAGRPGGGDVRPVDVPVIEGLGSGSFVDVVGDLVPTSTTTTAVPDSSAAYPRSPNSEETLAILAYYDGRNAARSPSALRQFWLMSAHPALRCTAADMEDILLPEADSPFWDEPLTMVPDLASITMVSYDEEFGPLATVERTNRFLVDGEPSESLPQRDQFFIVGGKAYQIFECGPPASASDSLSGASPRAQELFIRVHDTDVEAALQATFGELITPVDQQTAEDDFLAGIRWAWKDAISSKSDADLLEQAKVICDELSNRGAEAVYETYHVRGAVDLDTPFTELALWDRTMFYWGGRARCTDPASWAEWANWVLLDLESGYSEEKIGSLLYGYDNYEAGNTGPEYLTGQAAASSDDEWAEYLVELIEMIIAKPAPTPIEYGMLHANGTARLLAEGDIS